MCFKKVNQRNRLIFRNIHFLGENLRAAIDEKGLSRSLFVNKGDNFRCEGFALPLRYTDQVVHGLARV